MPMTPPFARRLCPWPLLVIAVLLGSTASFAAEVPQTVDFLTQVQPIFVEHCYACHGPDEQEAALRLDQRDAALAGGDSGAWFVPGKAAESEIVRRLTADESERMPPAEGNNKPLSDEQIATIKSWIDAGAAWPEANAAGSSHWAFQPIERPAPPPVTREAWARNPIDRFVLARLEAEGIAPSPEADRYTLIKRLSYDLLGLPPSVAQVDAFVADTSPEAYERLVDRLLDSPHFGERFGRHWLDKARYADSDGYEKDRPRPDAWRVSRLGHRGSQRRLAARRVHDRTVGRRLAARRFGATSSWPLPFIGRRSPTPKAAPTRRSFAWRRFSTAWPRPAPSGWG